MICGLNIYGNSLVDVTQTSSECGPYLLLFQVACSRKIQGQKELLGLLLRFPKQISKHFSKVS